MISIYRLFLFLVSLRATKREKPSRQSLCIQFTIDQRP